MASATLDEKAIFNVARQIDSPDARMEYLRHVCGADADLLGRVETLLGAYEEQASFLESPPARSASPTIDQPPLEKTGAKIGPYKLLQQIGEGGFGVVFMAEQLEPVRRRVALKLIKPGMDTRQVIARFEAERQALAVMDYPNIARVLDAGATDSGRPYFVMELVRGTPITQYCDENSLSIRERLALFASVCQAIQHAHTKGIIHRDIKPSNVLVTRQDGQPVVKVIDFGVAKAMGQQLTDKTLFTDFAQMIGTPLYMSPEQAELTSVDIDTRSDVYSLGVLLYELLTGSTPVSKEQLKQAAFDEIRRIIREDEPPKPSTRLESSRHAPRAIAEDGTRSVPTTLASIAAQRHTEPAKLTRLVRGELDWIVMKALEKDRSRRYETANGFAMDVQRYLADEPVQAGPPSRWYRFRKFARRNKRALGTAALLSAMLLVLAGGLGWMASDRATEHRQAVGLKSAYAYGHLNLGIALKEKGLLDEAIAEYREAIRLKPDRADAHIYLEVILADKGLVDEALFEGLKAVRLAPDSADAHHSLGYVLWKKQDREQAIAFYRKAIELEPNHFWAHYHLANAYRKKGQLDEAITWYRKTIALIPKFAQAHVELGLTFAAKQSWDEAIAEFREAIARCREFKPDQAPAPAREDLASSSRVWKFSGLTFQVPDLASALADAAWFLATSPDSKNRHAALAVELAKEADEIAPQSSVFWQSLGWGQYRAGNWTAAIEFLEKSCKRQKGGTGDSGQWIVLALAHAKLSAQECLPEKEREHHKTEARRRFDQADKQIDSWWRIRPDHAMGQDIWDFRVEARELMTKGTGDREQETDKK